jgi:hypothetical protein
VLTVEVPLITIGKAENIWSADFFKVVLDFSRNGFRHHLYIGGVRIPLHPHGMDPPLTHTS